MDLNGIFLTDFALTFSFFPIYKAFSGHEIQSKQNILSVQKNRKEIAGGIDPNALDLHSCS